MVLFELYFDLDELMCCEQHELIGTFLHLVTPAQESSLSQNHLCKILPVHNFIKIDVQSYITFFVN